MKNPNTQDAQAIKKAQAAFKLGFIGQYIANGSTVKEATEVANKAIASLKSAAARREKIRATIADRVGTSA